MKGFTGQKLRQLPNRSGSWACFALALIVLATIPEPFLPADVVRLRDVLQRSGLNRADYESMERGYYEDILDKARSVTSRAGEHGGDAPPPPNNEHGPTEERPILPVNDIREYVLQPSVDRQAFDTHWVTNRLGLRDTDYPSEKGPGTTRIALLGDSIACGWGVTQAERFEEIWEANLCNQTRAAGQSVEVWNFATPGHSPGQRWKNFEIVGDGIPFDLVVYEGTTSDPGWDALRMSHFMARSVGLDEPLYASTLKAAGFVPNTNPRKNSAQLRNWSWTILQNVYGHIVESCHERGLPVAFVLIPRVGANLGKFEKMALLNRARKAGFDYVIDLSDTFHGCGYRDEDLAISEGDYHPNALGHSILAEAWTSSLAQWPDLNRHLESGKERAQ
jgi:hypothetical protein